MKRPLLLAVLVLLLISTLWRYFTIRHDHDRRDHDRREAVRRSQVVFPLQGYLLVKAGDELSWYRVSVPQNRWTKIADGFFMLADEYDVIEDPAGCSLSKIEGKQVHTVNVLTGKHTFAPLPPGRTTPETPSYRLKGYMLAWNGTAWGVTGAGKHWQIPNRRQGLLGPSAKVPFTNADNMEPWEMFSPHEALFLKESFPTATSVTFDFILVDTLTGTLREVMHIPDENVHLIQDSDPFRIYLLNRGNRLERWRWLNHQFVKEGSWQLPEIDANESCGSLVTVVNHEWMMYQTLTQKLQWGLIAEPLRAKYYAFNLRSGQWAIVLDPPREHRGEVDVMAWIPKS